MVHSIRSRLYIGYIVLIAVIAVGLLVLGGRLPGTVGELIALGGPLLGLAVGTAIIVMRTTSAALLLPLERVNRALQALRQGQFGAVDEAGLPSELVPLVRSYNSMSQALELRQSQLADQLRRTALLTRLSIELRESLEPQAIIAHVLQVISSNTDADQASIMLLGPDGMIETASSLYAGQVQPVPQERARQVITHGLAGWVLRHSCAVVIHDVAADARWVALEGGRSVGSAMATPITHARATLGVLTITHSARERFDSRDMLLLEGIAAQAGVAISVAQHQSQERRRREQALLLFSMSQFLTARRSARDLAAELLETSSPVFEASASALFLAAPGGEQLELFATFPAAINVPQSQLDSVAYRAWASRAALTAQTAQSPELPQTAYVALPLLHNGVAIGAFVLVRAGGAATFTADVWWLLTIFTNVAAAAFANQQLVERLQQRADELEQMVGERTCQLQHSRDTLRVIFDNLPDGLLLLDAEARILTANQSFCRTIVGRRPQHIVGQSYPALVAELAHSTEIQISLQPTGDPASWRAQTTDTVGQQRWYSVERLHIADTEHGAQAIERWRDVTRQEELHRQLQLHEQLTTLGRLAASLAHEIGNPLQSVRGCLDLCREDPGLAAPTGEYLELANTELDRVGRLIERLRELYRPPHEGWEAVDLNAQVRIVRQALASQLAGRAITIDLCLDPELPAVAGQAEALRQVVLNLVLNAYDAMPRGGAISIDTSADGRLRSCTLSVSDSGIGISAERIERIFEPFQSSRPQQLGLGLFLSRMIIERHQGSITIASSPSTGTKASVCLPYGEEKHG